MRRFAKIFVAGTPSTHGPKTLRKRFQRIARKGEESRSVLSIFYSEPSFSFRSTTKGPKGSIDAMKGIKACLNVQPSDDLVS